MADDFKYDVFLSHSAKDKAVVLAVAERLRVDGLRVWLDDWELDRIPAKRIERGLERSRVLVLCISAHAFGSEWEQLEYGTFRFRDPLNKERRSRPRTTAGRRREGRRSDGQKREAASALRTWLDSLVGTTGFPWSRYDTAAY
ncbi:MAG: toll/interleukin-1 receptor domain-containing protein [Thermoanaerobaculia bacterium]